MPSEPVILEEGATLAGATLAYPGNLTLWNLADFITLPTLVYQMAYPRTRVIRWRWLLMCAALAIASLHIANAQDVYSW